MDTTQHKKTFYQNLFLKKRFFFAALPILIVTATLALEINSTPEVLNTSLINNSTAGDAERTAPETYAPFVASAVSMADSVPQTKDGIAITTRRDAPNQEIGISVNSEVTLTDQLAAVGKAFGKYLEAHDAWAVITSGKRTSEGQLDIIKERIVERGAEAKFPNLEDASVADWKTWLKAWQWLRRRHVPVNAPAAVPGADVRTSMHLEGRAMDLISDNLDHLRGMLADFSRSKFARNAPLHITAIVREPGCVHINLA